MPNPISTKIRGWLYVAGVVLGVLSASAGAVITAVESQDTGGIVLAVIGTLYALSNVLARANLNPEGSDGSAD